MLGGPFSPWPSFSQEEAEIVQRVLLSNKVNYWTGDEGRNFETEFAEWCGTEYAVAVANGTVALDLAWKALGIGDGDEIIVTPRTFIASISSIVNAGAVPVFADVDPDSQNITPETVAPVMTPRTRAILCVHLAGWPCDMDGFRYLLSNTGGSNIRLVEDCAQAHGAHYKGRPVGGLGDIGCWSFCQDKIMTTGGEGGMVTTDDRGLRNAMWAYKDHGKSWEAVYEREHPPGFRWVHDGFGTNWRMAEMQSAIGRFQLTRMEDWHAARARNSSEILAAARSCPALRVPDLPGSIEHGWYKCYVFVRPEVLAEGWSRDRIIDELNDRGVPCRSGSCSEVYLEHAFDQTRFKPATRLPVARQLGETSLMFLVHPTLTKAEIGLSCEVLRSVMEAASS